MDIATDLIAEIDSDAILATDGSIEGLMTSLSMRPGRPSIFLRDEFSGLLEALTKKDYYAGMGETLTKLYDGKLQKRILRKEVIEVRDPVLIFFAGGIKSRILELLNAEHVGSGFLPRFVLITAESDVASLKPLGPPTEKSLDGRQSILKRLHKIWNHYTADVVSIVNGTQVITKARWDAELTPEAWAKYNKYEAMMLDQALKLQRPELMTPTFDRLSKSGLKVAVLIAAVRNQGPKLVVEEEDIVRAFYYVERWRIHTLEVLAGVGRTSAERTLQKVYNFIKNNPGCMRSVVMQNYHLSARETDAILQTLDQRGLISRTNSGRSERLAPVEAKV